MSGKGSSPRPFSVPRKTYEDNWEKIFSKKKEKQEKNSPQKQENK
jgi:hypothetical protein